MVAGNVERRSMGALGRMGIVAGAHAVLILLVGRGLGIVPPLVDKPDDLFTRFYEQPVIHDEPPPAVHPTIENQDIHVPLPEPVPIEMSTDVIPAMPTEPGRIDIDTGDGPGSATIPKIEGVRMDGRRPLSQPRYPAPDTRLGNEGTLDVEVYVLPTGRVGDARIARSSGFERLDQSAIDEAKRNWRLVPATRDGVPFAEWYKVRVTFKLTNER